MKIRVLALVGLFLMSVNAWGDPTSFDRGLDAVRDGYYAQAAELFAPLAREGVANAEFGLGLLYHSGSGVVQDEDMAVWLYHEAAKHGSTLAQEYLIVGYQEGWFGLKKNAEKAKYWHTQHARQTR